VAVTVTVIFFEIIGCIPFSAVVDTQLVNFTFSLFPLLLWHPLDGICLTPTVDHLIEKGWSMF
jgi:hypothetical protein